MNYYDEIKKELLRNEVSRRVKTYSINRADLKTYYKVGKILSEAGKHYIIRGQKVMLDSDLAKIYGYSTKALYHCGSSLKDASNKISVITKIEDTLIYKHTINDLLQGSTLTLK